MGKRERESSSASSLYLVAGRRIQGARELNKRQKGGEIERERERPDVWEGGRKRMEDGVWRVIASRSGRHKWMSFRKFLCHQCSGNFSPWSKRKEGRRRNFFNCPPTSKCTLVERNSHFISRRPRIPGQGERSTLDLSNSTKKKRLISKLGLDALYCSHRFTRLTAMTTGCYWREPNDSYSLPKN